MRSTDEVFKSVIQKRNEYDKNYERNDCMETKKKPMIFRHILTAAACAVVAVTVLALAVSPFIFREELPEESTGKIIPGDGSDENSKEAAESVEESAEEPAKLEWPAEFFPEKFPVPKYTDIYSVEYGDNSVRVVLIGKKSLTTSYANTFAQKILAQGYIRDAVPETGLISYYNRDGLKVTICESHEWTGEHLKEIAESSSTGYAFEVTAEYTEPLADYLYWTFPDENTDLGLEEIKFDEWPAEYLPENFPNPKDSQTIARMEEAKKTEMYVPETVPQPDGSITIVKMEQKKNGMFITLRGNMYDLSAYGVVIWENMGYAGEFPCRNSNGDYMYSTETPVDDRYTCTVTYQICPPNNGIVK